MRLVVQRVSSARVRVKGKEETVGEIGRGLFVLVGVGEGDSEKDAENLAEKLSKLRIMSDSQGKMNLSVKDLAAQAGIDAEILVISQFTLYADTTGGNRPSFIKAAEPGKAEAIYNKFVELLRGKGIKVETGKFGAYMEIEVNLDGPVTIIL